MFAFASSMISSVSVFESSVKPLVSTQLSIEVRCPRLFLGQAPCRVCSGRVLWQLAGAGARLGCDL